ncbi:MAG: zinc-ribbon domain-containing protein [Treponema sp.]|nr:zinc-ribbon domain-containing protein [Treponema sp.]
MSKKKPLFFCDNCGYEVGDNVKACPYCARLFVSVRCPACTYSGPDRMFQNGCPMCGYSAPPPPKVKEPKIKPPPPIPPPPAEPLPFWTYIITFTALLAVIALFSYFITR